MEKRSEIFCIMARVIVCVAAFVVVFVAACTTCAAVCVTLPADERNVSGNAWNAPDCAADCAAEAPGARMTFASAVDTVRHDGGPHGIKMKFIVEKGDTVLTDNLQTAYVFGSTASRQKGRAWREYRRLVYNFRKVYPYALEARRILREADSVIASGEFTQKQREEYLDAYQKRLFRTFEKPLRKLSVSQGRLLLRLIDRELGRTSYYIIREYRGRFSAGFWQAVARIFGNDLKRPYDRFGEDRATEDLVELYEKGAFDALYFSMFLR